MPNAFLACASARVCVFECMVIVVVVAAAAGDAVDQWLDLGLRFAMILSQ